MYIAAIATAPLPVFASHVPSLQLERQTMDTFGCKENPLGSDVTTTGFLVRDRKLLI
jgi:hypothetical protein